MGEIGRRLVHSSGVGFPALYLLGLASWTHVQWLLIFGSVGAIVLETVRLRVGLDWWIYEKLTRPYEANSLAGYAYYMFSITAVGLVFQPEIAVPAMLMVMIGDPISGYLGSGKLRPVKGRVPVVAMFLVCTGLAIPFTIERFETAAVAVVAAAAAAAAATVADAVKPTVGEFVVDDNLSIPIVAAIVLWITGQLAGV